MASKFYGVPLGGDMIEDVTVGTSTTSKAIELQVVTDTTNLTKTDVLRALSAIEQKIIGDTWPPA